MLDTTHDEQHNKKFFNHSLVALIFLLIVRIIAICLVPLNDYSESRYAEIARKMLETGNWVTPQLAYGVPFWAKPPLSTWLSAVSMKLFGVNEFAVRLPGLLLSIAVLWLIWSLAKKHSGEAVAWVATLVLAASLYFFLDAGTVMTDPSLVFCTTLSMVAFWRAFVDEDKLWSYLFFVGLGLGLLAKGPVAVVLVGLPIFFWILVRNEWVNLWKKLPWIRGILITLAIALPWYILAELRTPGFINYFIVGENFNRFIHPGWGGDKYGHAHGEPWGMIWVYVLIGISPWSILVGAWFIRYRKKILSVYRDEDGWMSYLLLSMVVPLLFFTFASNIIYTYTFPSLAAFALLFTEAWSRAHKSLADLKWILPFALITGVGFLVATFIFEFKPEWVAKTQKAVVSTWQAQHPSADSPLIYWEYLMPYSAEFYSAGKILNTKDLSVLCKQLSNNRENYLVIDPRETAELPVDLYAKLTPVYTNVYKDKTRILMRSPVLTC